MSTVLVCGSHTSGSRRIVFDYLDRLHAQKPIALLVEGGAKIIDSYAYDWAQSRGVTTLTVVADWWVDGLEAGPLRNTEMLLERPDLVVAFPGGPGTRNMMRQAKLAGVEVLDVELEMWDAA